MHLSTWRLSPSWKNVTHEMALPYTDWKSCLLLWFHLDLRTLRSQAKATIMLEQILSSTAFICQLFLNLVLFFPHFTQLQKRKAGKEANMENCRLQGKGIGQAIAQWQSTCFSCIRSWVQSSEVPIKISQAAPTGDSWRAVASHWLGWPVVWLRLAASCVYTKSLQKDVQKQYHGTLQTHSLSDMLTLTNQRKNASVRNLSKC